MDGLALQIEVKDSSGAKRWEWVTLADDTSISIEMSSPIFGTGATFSYPFTIPVEPNRHILGNADQLHGARLHDTIHKCAARLYLCGIPFRKGIIRLDNEVKISEDGELEIEFTSERGEWDEMIDGMNARDVELLNRFQIGYGTPDQIDMTLSIGQVLGGWHATTGYRSEGNIIESWHKTKTQMSMAKLMTPKDKNGNVLVNLSEAFNPESPTSYPYCTIRACVQARKTKDDGDAEKADDEEEARGYKVLEYDRINTGICMYAGYFVRCLFNHLGVVMLSNTLENVEDYRRLFFLSTQCHYEVDANGSTALAPKFKDIGVSFSGGDKASELYIAMDCWGSAYLGRTGCLYYNGEYHDEDSPITDLAFSQTLFPAYATKENFPDKDVKEIIEAIEHAFCARLMYDSAAGTARIVLLRDVLRDSATLELKADIHSVEKTENNIRGVRLTYGESSDTAFRYTHNESVIKEITDYAQLIRSISAHDRALYYNPVNGKEYRIKVDEDAKSESELHPSLFEVEQFADSVNGDCSDDDTTEVINMGFVPATMNDVNFEEEKTKDTKQQSFAFFVGDATIHTDANKQIVRNTIGLYYDYEWNNSVRISTSTSIKGGRIAEIPVYITYQTGQNWDMADSFEGPLQDNDTGLMFCINRGPGSEGGVTAYDENYDGEGNSRWALTPGNYASHSDTCDEYGRQWDYNGTRSGLQDGASGDPAIAALLRSEFSQSNADLANRTAQTALINDTIIFNIPDNNGVAHPILLAQIRDNGWYVNIYELGIYASEHLDGKSVEDMLSTDNALLGIIVDVDTTEARQSRLSELQYQLIHGNGAPSGRFSLCLRAEKPNPNFDPSRPEGQVTTETTYTGGEETITTAERAVEALRLFLPSNKVDALIVPFIMRHRRIHAYEYDNDESDYAVSFYPIYYDITDNTGVTHHALLSPWHIDTHELVYKPNLELTIGYAQGKDVDTIKRYLGSCLVELDSTAARGSMFRGLLDIVQGISSTPVTVTLPNGTITTTTVNNRYLDITDPLNQRRGIGEQFYSEYIHWLLNSRKATYDVTPELAELLRIDLTKKYYIGDTLGYINKVNFNADMGGIHNVKVEQYYL